jgi:hypothetical protein
MVAALAMTAGRQRWFDHLPAVTAEVPCGKQPHRITWRRSKLVLDDHDVLAERSLVALGAEPPLCLQMLDAWGQPVLAPGMLDRLVLDDRALDPDELLLCRLRYERAVDVASQQSAFAGRLSPAVGGRVRAALKHRSEHMLEREQRMWESALIESLPPELRRRRALAGIVRLARIARSSEDGYRPLELPEFMLRSVAAPLVEHSVRRWRRNLKPYASVLVEARLPAPGGAGGLYRADRQQRRARDAHAPARMAHRRLVARARPRRRLLRDPPGGPRAPLVGAGRRRQMAARSIRPLDSGAGARDRHPRRRRLVVAAVGLSAWRSWQ